MSFSLFCGCFGFVICIGLYHLRTRQSLLMANVVTAGCFSVYQYSQDVKAGALVSTLIAVSCAAQICVETFNLDPARINTAKNSICLIAIGLGTVLIYKTPVDILPIIAFSRARFADKQDSPQDIRITYLPCIFIWLTYFSIHELWLMTSLQVVELISIAIAIGHDANWSILSKHRPIQGSGVESYV